MTMDLVVKNDMPFAILMAIFPGEPGLEFG